MEQGYHLGNRKRGVGYAQGKEGGEREEAKRNQIWMTNHCTVLQGLGGLGVLEEDGAEGE